MTNLQPVRGTRDLLPEEWRKFRYVQGTSRAIAELYGFQEIETPILEPVATFKRTLGDTSDIVSKEMYIFKDLSGDELALRPEGTAGVARAFISEGLSQHLPLKLFYSGPMFRHERPQKGRYRQFYQFGVEFLGVEKPQADVEVLAMASHILRAMKLQGDLVLHLNSIGDAASRATYRERLVAYLDTRRPELSKDSLERLERNPLRILDSKDEGDRRVVADAPSMKDFLNDASRAFFDGVVEGVTALGIPHTIDPLLVRGLDYYCHTVFEFTTSALGAQNTVLSGGRYDTLISGMGGPQTPGVGWASGVDRLVLMLDELEGETRPVAVIPLGEEAERAALKLAQQLRESGIKVDMAYGGNMAKRMKRANKVRARHAVILGSDELARNIVQLKTLDTGEQREVSLAGLATALLE